MGLRSGDDVKRIQVLRGQKNVIHSNFSGLLVFRRVLMDRRRLRRAIY